MGVENMCRERNPKYQTKAYFNYRTKNFLIHKCRLVLAPTGRMKVMLPYQVKVEFGRKVFEKVIEFLDVDYIEAVTAEAVAALEELSK